MNTYIILRNQIGYRESNIVDNCVFSGKKAAVKKLRNLRKDEGNSMPKYAFHIWRVNNLKRISEPSKSEMEQEDLYQKDRDRNFQMETASDEMCVSDLVALLSKLDPKTSLLENGISVYWNILLENKK